MVQVKSPGVVWDMNRFWTANGVFFGETTNTQFAKLTGAHDPGTELVMGAQADQPAGVEAIEPVGGCLERKEVWRVLHRGGLVAKCSNSNLRRKTYK